MNEFQILDLSAETPDAICHECAKAGVWHAPTQTQIAYCSHALKGAYRAPGQEWKIISGIEPHYFREVVIRGLTKAELRIDAARGLAALFQNDAENSTKH